MLTEFPWDQQWKRGVRLFMCSWQSVRGPRGRTGLCVGQHTPGSLSATDVWALYCAHRKLEHCSTTSGQNINMSTFIFKCYGCNSEVGSSIPVLYLWFYSKNIHIAWTFFAFFPHHRHRRQSISFEFYVIVQYQAVPSCEMDSFFVLQKIWKAGDALVLSPCVSDIKI